MSIILASTHNEFQNNWNTCKIFFPAPFVATYSVCFKQVNITQFFILGSEKYNWSMIPEMQKLTEIRNNNY
jgi:hypothetical protein